MTGFLNGKNARQFMDELWALLLSAQDTESGIPVEFLDQKKEEIKKRMVCIFGILYANDTHLIYVSESFMNA